MTNFKKNMTSLFTGHDQLLSLFDESRSKGGPSRSSPTVDGFVVRIRRQYMEFILYLRI